MQWLTENFMIIHSKYFPNSDWLKAQCDQIWKNFVFNKKMTSKMQSTTG